MDQPTGLGMKGGLSIYEQAAMQADPFTVPAADEDQDDG